MGKLSAAIDKYESAKTLRGNAEKTIQQYEYVLNGFGEFLGQNPELEDIEADDIRSFLKYLKEEKELADTTVAIHHRVLNAFFNWFLEESEIEESPMGHIPEPSTSDKFPRIISREEVNQLLENERDRMDEWAGMRNYTMLMMFLEMGLRRSELINASVNDLNLESRNLKVHGKGAKDRRVRFGENTRRLMRKWLRVREDIRSEVTSETIIIDQRGNKIKARNLNRLISRIADRAGVGRENVSPHVLRHTSATMAVENGVDNYTLLQQYGWQSSRTAKRYVHMVGKRFDEAFDKVSPMDNFDGNQDRNESRQSADKSDRGDWVNN